PQLMLVTAPASHRRVKPASRVDRTHAGAWLLSPLMKRRAVYFSDRARFISQYTERYRFILKRLFDYVKCNRAPAARCLPPGNRKPALLRRLSAIFLSTMHEDSRRQCGAEECGLG